MNINFIIIGWLLTYITGSHDWVPNQNRLKMAGLLSQLVQLISRGKGMLSLQLNMIR